MTQQSYKQIQVFLPEELHDRFLRVIELTNESKRSFLIKAIEKGVSEKEKELQLTPKK